MTFYKPKTLRSALYPTLFFCWLVGIGKMEFFTRSVKNSYRSVISVSYSTAILILFTMSTIPTFKSFDSCNEPRSLTAIRIIYSAACGFAIILTIVNILHSAISYKKVDDFISELMDIDKFIKHSGIVRSYPSLVAHQFKRFLVFVTILAIFICYYIVTNECNAEESYFDKILKPSGYFICVFTVTVSEVTFITFNEIMKSAFEDLNSMIIRTLKERQKCKNGLDGISPVAGLIQVLGMERVKQDLHVLFSIRTAHSQLTRLARYWVEFNGSRLILSILSNFAMITICMGIFFERDSSETFLNVLRVCGLILPCAKILFIVDSTSSLVTEANRTSGILLGPTYDMTSISAEVQRFSLHLIQNRLRLSVSGIVPLDHSVLIKIMGTAITLLVITIQMNTNKGKDEL